MTQRVYRVFEPEEKQRIASRILHALPDWFEVPESRQTYIDECAEQPVWAAGENGAPIGFIALAQTAPKAAELRVMGVLPEHHRQGIGRQLFAALYAHCQEQGVDFLQVKTLAAGCDEGFDRTRLFYESLGFCPLEVFPTLWDEKNPCLQMVMAVGKTMSIKTARD